MSDTAFNKIGIIPARYSSTRFPGKPLAEIHGKSMIQRVYEQACKAKLDTVLVATDDDRIFKHVKSFGGKVVMTSVDHLSGTDRCQEVAEQYGDDAIIVNIQGDEPFIHPEQLNELIQVFVQNPSVEIATQCKQIAQNDLIFDPNIVKVVRNTDNYALYFSRNPIPFLRNVPNSDWAAQNMHFKHIGVYAFRNSILRQLSQLQNAVLEQAESLEQLRWLANGFKIFVAETEYETFGIDVPDDLNKIVL